MGVIDRKNLEKRNSEKNEAFPSEDELSIPEETSEGEVSAADETHPVHLSTKRHRGRKPEQVYTPSKPRKHSGKRRLRQYRAVEDLRSLWFDTEDVLEITIHDFMNIKPSPFAILLQDQVLLKAWWEFISNPEPDLTTCSKCQAISAEKSGDYASPPRPPEYKKIERYLRDILQRKSMDINMVADVELLLGDFFARTPKDILRVNKLTRYEAMINTAVCQYHGLQTELAVVSKKKNDLFVTLLGDCYTQPATALHDYLEERQKFYVKAT